MTPLELEAAEINVITVQAGKGTWYEIGKDK